MIAIALFIAAAATALPRLAPTPSPQRVLGLIRARFRSHRPPPPYIAYTLVRSQLTDQGYPDYVGSYTYRIWCRNSDHAALGRKAFRADYRGPLEFLHPAFNAPQDPGPPTADVFEPAPAVAHAVSASQTPQAERSALPVIASVVAVGEFDYRVTSLQIEGQDLHLRIEPIRQPERNRLRELWADKTTYELRKLTATDKLYVEKGGTYAVAFTITMGMFQGMPVVTDVHGDVGGGYFGDGQKVDYHFGDIAFPPTLPAWYFDPRTYAAHEGDAPS
jgi:hypothetical protein